MSAGAIVLCVGLLVLCAVGIFRAARARGRNWWEKLSAITGIALIAALVLAVPFLILRASIAAWALLAVLLVGILILGYCWVVNRMKIAEAAKRDLVLGRPTLPREASKDGIVWLAVFIFVPLAFLTYAGVFPWVILITLFNGLQGVGDGTTLGQAGTALNNDFSALTTNFWTTPAGWLPAAIDGVVAASVATARYFRRRAAIQRHGTLVSGIESRLRAEREVGYGEGLAAGRSGK